MLEGHSREDANMTNASPFHNFANNLFSENKITQSESHKIIPIVKPTV